MKNPHVNSDDAGALDGVNDAKLFKNFLYRLRIYKRQYLFFRHFNQ